MGHHQEGSISRRGGPAPEAAMWVGPHPRMLTTGDVLRTKPQVCNSRPCSSSSSPLLEPWLRGDGGAVHDAALGGLASEARPAPLPASREAGACRTQPRREQQQPQPQQADARSGHRLSRHAEGCGSGLIGDPPPQGTTPQPDHHQATGVLLGGAVEVGEARGPRAVLSHLGPRLLAQGSEREVPRRRPARVGGHNSGTRG